MGSKWKHYCNIIALNFGSFAVSSLFPIANKELYFYAPFPVFTTFIEMVISAFASFLLVFFKSKKKKFPKFYFPENRDGILVFYSGIFFGLMMGANNLGQFISDVDFAQIFKVAGIIFQGLVAFFIFKERATVLGWVSMAVVAIGALFSTFNFNYDITNFSSLSQIVFHSISLMITSVSMIANKFAAHRTNKNNEMLIIVGWRYIYSSIILGALSMYLEPGAWLNFSKVLISIPTILWILVGTLLGILFQLCQMYLSKLSSMLSLVIIGQLKIVPTLVISHILYNTTKWTIGLVIGTCLMLIGAIGFSISRI